ncbi:helix-turn-helix domain-containing protein [Thalassoporum mexicanum]|nr:helix-turn-helix domain-containing protein [Pseudanabaena sp. PCC 7367]
MNDDRTSQLSQLMQAAQIDSFKQLCDRAQISTRALTKLRQGELAKLRYEQINSLAQSLQISVHDLVAVFGKQNADLAAISSSQGEKQASQPQALKIKQTEQMVAAQRELVSQIERLNRQIFDLKTEYIHLQAQQAQQESALRSRFEQEIIQKLESFWLQWPTAAHAAQQNEKMPARNLVPLLRPVENLLKGWDIEAIGQVGAELEFDPHWHQAMSGEAIALGTTVVVRYVGYRRGEALLYRARVDLKT